MGATKVGTAGGDKGDSVIAGNGQRRPGSGVMSWLHGHAPGLGMGAIVLCGAIVLWFRFNVTPGQKGQPFPLDLILYYYPMLAYATERLAQGEIPLWSPYYGCGAPFLATAQVAIFYPGTWLALILPVGAALTVLMFGQVLLGGLFAALYFRSLAVSAYGSAIGGVLFIFACSLGQTFWPSQVSTIVWLPFLLLCVERFVARGPTRMVAGLRGRHRASIPGRLPAIPGLHVLSSCTVRGPSPGLWLDRPDVQQTSSAAKGRCPRARLRVGARACGRPVAPDAGTCRQERATCEAQPRRRSLPGRGPRAARPAGDASQRDRSQAEAGLIRLLAGCRLSGDGDARDGLRGTGSVSAQPHRVVLPGGGGRDAIPVVRSSGVVSPVVSTI